MNPVLCPGWDEMIADSPEGGFFHSTNWAGVLMDSYSYKPIYFTSMEGASLRGLIAVMEVDSSVTGKRGVSLPFTDVCEPILSEDRLFDNLLGDALEYGRKAGWKYLELRGGAKTLNGAVPFRSYVRHILALHDSEKELFKGFNSATRRNIRKAADSGVQISISCSEADMDKYYRLHCLTRKRHGVPPQPLGFFKAVHRNVISRDKGFIVLADWQGRPVSGSIYFHFGKKAIYKFGASDLNFQHLRAANLVMWEAIRWFSKNGFDEFCFGRTEPENAGLIRFKTGWGGRQEPVYYYRYDMKKSAFVKGAQSMDGQAERIFRLLPVPLLRVAGRMLYRHMG